MRRRHVTGQRSFEYDSITDTYVRFLTTELLPFAEEQIGKPFSKDPAHRTIVGISSGGICRLQCRLARPHRLRPSPQPLRLLRKPPRRPQLIRTW